MLREEIDKKWSVLHLELNKSISDSKLDKEAFRFKHEYIHINWEKELIAFGYISDEARKLQDKDNPTQDLVTTELRSVILTNKLQKLENYLMQTKGITTAFIEELK